MTVSVNPEPNDMIGACMRFGGVDDQEGFDDGALIGEVRAC